MTVHITAQLFFPSNRGRPWDLGWANYGSQNESTPAGSSDGAPVEVRGQSFQKQTTGSENNV